MKRFEKIATSTFATIVAILTLTSLDWALSGHDRFLNRLLKFTLIAISVAVVEWLGHMLPERKSAAPSAALVGGIVFGFSCVMDLRRFYFNLTSGVISAVLWFALSKWGPSANSIQTLFGDKSQE